MLNIFKKIIDRKSSIVNGEIREEWEARMDKFVEEMKEKDEEYVKLSEELRETYAEYQKNVEEYNKYMAENYPKAIIELIEENRDKQINAIDETMKYFK